MWNITRTFLVNWRVNELHLYISKLYDYDLLLFYHQQIFCKSNKCYLIEIIILLQLWSNFDYNIFLITLVFILFKNCFNKFISRIFFSVNNSRLAKFIININKFAIKTTRNVILIFFEQKSLTNFQFCLKYTHNLDKF